MAVSPDYRSIHLALPFGISSARQWRLRPLRPYVRVMFPLHLCDQRCVYFSSMTAVTLAMGNQPITSIVSTTCFQRYIMANIPFFSRQHLHTAQVAYALMPHENVGSHLRCDANTLH
jgi:hypothetical protein